MLRASLYITLCTAKNRLLVRLRRLRQPRYLIFAIAGAAYVYFTVFIRFRAVRTARRPGGEPTDIFTPAFKSMAPAAGGIAILTMAALAWVFPARSTLFDFSEAEVHLLFPAPVTRRALLIHRLVRSQLRILFGAFVVSFFVANTSLTDAAGAGSSAGRVLRVVAVWIVFVTIRVYFAGVTLARAHLTSGDVRVRWTAWTPILATTVAFAVVGVPLGRGLFVRPMASLDDLPQRLADIAARGWPRIMLWPFMSLMRPMFADDLGARLVAVGGALIVLTAVTAWVLRSDDVFQATRADERQDERPLVAPPRVPRARTINWALRATGSTEGVIFWKNGMEALRGTKLMSMLPFIFPLAAIGVAAATAGMSLTGASGSAAGLSIAALAIAVIFTLIGPQGTRSDMRGDLRHLAQLKTWPIKPAALIRGELLWPAASLTVFVWFALTSGTVLSAAAFPEVPVVTRLSLCGAAFLLAPALIVAQLLVHNAAAVLFPAWVPIGTQRSRGLDSLGQRLILFGGVMLALILVVGPGAIAGAVVAFLFYRWIGAAVAVPAAAACFAVVAVEVLLATEALGAAFDRIDLSAVEPAE